MFMNLLLFVKLLFLFFVLLFQCIFNYYYAVSCFASLKPVSCHLNELSCNHKYKHNIKLLQTLCA